MDYSESNFPETVKGAGLGLIHFWNWNCWSIPILIPELELVELKMKLELKTVELELKTGIDFFCNCYHITY